MEVEKEESSLKDDRKAWKLGFAEVEYGMLRYMGAIDDSTLVVTSGSHVVWKVIGCELLKVSNITQVGTPTTKMDTQTHYGIHRHSLIIASNHNSATATAAVKDSFLFGTQPSLSTKPHSYNVLQARSHQQQQQCILQRGCLPGGAPKLAK
ncbi:5-formyltetrahydrofolate cyclo-ligase protein [Trifolium repens]|nr:5-formyltetrahydrofolate cyclo-ligase protein [Trifolium repens]